jgi:hypothetical protein
MIRTSIEKLSEEIGFDIGNSDDVTQANLLNGFCQALKHSMNKSHLETQAVYIAKNLKPEARYVLKLISEFIDITES